MLYKRTYTSHCIKVSENEYILGFGTKQYIVNLEKFKKIKKVLLFLEKVQEEEILYDFLKENTIEKEILEEMLEKKLITTFSETFQKEDNLEFKNNIYLDTTFLESEKISKKIKETVFIIIGCGGIGNYVSYAISTHTPKKIVLIDGDRIEKGNLNRQFLFELKDIGKFKAEIISKKIKDRNDKLNTNVEFENVYMNKDILEKYLKKYKNENVIIVISGDDETVLEDTMIVSRKYNVPFLNVGYLNDISVIGPFYIPDISSCPYCNNKTSIDSYKNYDNDISKINGTYSSPASFVNSGFASAMAMVDIYHYLSGNFENINSLNKRIGLNNSTFERYELVVEKDENCEYCK